MPRKMGIAILLKKHTTIDHKFIDTFLCYYSTGDEERDE